MSPDLRSEDDYLTVGLSSHNGGHLRAFDNASALLSAIDALHGREIIRTSWLIPDEIVLSRETQATFE